METPQVPTSPFAIREPVRRLTHSRPRITPSHSPDRSIDLSLVIPVHNEQDNIRPLLEEIVRALDGRLNYEIIYAEDGSTDETPTRLQDSRQEFPHLRILRFARRCGQSTAIRAGVAAARARWIATLDGDGQNNPADLLRLLEHRHKAANRRLALITGWRAKRHDTWIRRVSSRIANGVRARVLGDQTLDTGCGLKLFLRDVFLGLPYFDHMHRFLPALVQRAGWEVVAIEVTHRHRKHGRSKYGVNDRLWVGIVDLLGVAWLKRRAKVPRIVEIR
ncbi:MAG: glycosyltransferase [Acidiferrobacterales bacterium]